MQCVECSLKLDQRVAGHGGDAALVILIARHFDVALEAPGLAPAVLDEPIVIAVVGSVANNEDAVVKLLLVALGLLVDAVFVELEAGVSGVDSDRDRA